MSLRKRQADRRGIAPYMVFTDQVLQQLARDRPTTIENFKKVEGVEVAFVKYFVDLQGTKSG